MKRNVRKRIKIIHRDGEWVSVHMPRMYLTCCDCGLTHRLRFAIINNGTGVGLQVSGAPGKTRKHRKAKQNYVARHG